MQEADKAYEARSRNSSLNIPEESEEHGLKDD
jgi:hypothetical protein